MTSPLTTLVVGANLPTIDDLPSLLIPSRACGTCSLCCKVFPVPELQKPRSVLCRHCIPGSGCGMHETRPPVCRRFFCNWLLLETLGPEWKPENCHFVLQSNAHADGHQGLTIWLDSDYPESSRASPYRERIGDWVEKAWHASRNAYGPIYYVMIYLDGRIRLLLPGREIELGTIESNDGVQLERRVSRSGTNITARIMPGHWAG